MVETDPLELGWSALYAEAMRGPAAGRMTETIGRTVAAWADEPDVGVDDMRARAEVLWDRFGTEEGALRERLAELSDVPAAAGRVLAALVEATATLAAIASP